MSSATIAPAHLVACERVMNFSLVQGVTGPTSFRSGRKFTCATVVMRETFALTMPRALRLAVFLALASTSGEPAAEAQDLSAVLALDATRIAGSPDAAAWNAAPIRSEFV